MRARTRTRTRAHAHAHTRAHAHAHTFYHSLGVCVCALACLLACVRVHICSKIWISYILTDIKFYCMIWRTLVEYFFLTS